MKENKKDFLNINDILNYQKTFKPINDSCFKNYLGFLYQNLLLREQGTEHSETTDYKKSFSQTKKNESEKGMSLNVFLQYMDIQSFIGERIYKYMNKSKSHKLSKSDFTQGFNSIFFGDIKELIKFTFFLCDFNEDGKIYKSDMKLILAYIPIETPEKQSEEIKHTNSIINNYFTKLVKEFPEKMDVISLEITSKLYENHIMQFISNNNIDNNFNSNGSLLLLLKLINYIYQNKPFVVENVNTFKFNKNKTNTNKNIFTQTVQLKNKISSDMVTNKLSNTLVQKSSNQVNIQPYKEPTNNEYASTKSDLPQIDLFQAKKEKIRENISPTMKEHKNLINDNEFKIKLSPLKGFNTIRPKINKSIHYSKQTINENINQKKNDEILAIINNDMQINDESDLFSNDINDNNLNKSKVEFLEESCYKYSEEEITKCLKKYYAIIRGKEILFYSSKKKNEFCSIWNFNKTVIELSGGTVDVGKHSYYAIKITFYNRVTKIIYFEDEKIQKKFGKFLISRINYKKFNDIFEVNEKLGQGHFAIVKRCTEKKTGKEYAVKIMNKKTMKPKDLTLVLQEKNYLSLIKHPNIAPLIADFEDNDNIYFVMDYLKGGDLANYILKSEKVNSQNREKIAAKITKIIAQGIQYLNYFGIVHRDIKPENILFEKKDEIKSIKIIDLGVAIILPYGASSKDPLGTLDFIAPEIFEHKPYSHKVDVWSLGVLLYYLVTGGVVPFDDENDETVGKKIVFTHQEYPENLFGDKSKSLERLIDKALEKNPEKRITITNFLKEEWLNKYSK